MKITLNKTSFVSEIKKIRLDNFSVAALEMLFDWYEEMERDCDIQLEFDPIAICCDWSEYDEVDLIEEFGGQAGIYGEDATVENLIDWLRDETYVIEMCGSVLVMTF